MWDPYRPTRLLLHIPDRDKKGWDVKEAVRGSDYHDEKNRRAYPIVHKLACIPLLLEGSP